MKLIKQIYFWLKAARLHTMPMSLMSWLVVFCWAFGLGGKIFNGILALFGIMLAHLGVNLIDDYFDYKSELNEDGKLNEDMSVKRQKGKCRYLVDGQVTLKQTGYVVFIYFAMASLIGLYLLVDCGWQVAAISAIAGIFCLLYPFLTYWGLGEFAVGLLFGPLLFAGTSFVMLGTVPFELLILSISTGLLTVGLLHTHALMDFDFDIKYNKKTLCTALGSKKKSLWALDLMMFFAYANIIFGIIFKKFDPVLLLTLLSAPLAFALHFLMEEWIKAPNVKPQKKFWLGPMENWNEIVANGAESFMLKFYVSRNIMMFFTLLLCIGLLLS